MKSGGGERSGATTRVSRCRRGGGGGTWGQLDWEGVSRGYTRDNPLEEPPRAAARRLRRGARRGARWASPTSSARALRRTARQRCADGTRPGGVRRQGGSEVRPDFPRGSSNIRGSRSRRSRCRNSSRGSGGSNGAQAVGVATTSSAMAPAITRGRRRSSIAQTRTLALRCSGELKETAVPRRRRSSTNSSSCSNSSGARRMHTTLGVFNNNSTTVARRSEATAAPRPSSIRGLGSSGTIMVRRPTIRGQ